MFIELVGSLRCVRQHRLTWLVVSAYRMDARDIVSGELGCPACSARYPIERGIADFRDPEGSAVSQAGSPPSRELSPAPQPALASQPTPARTAAREGRGDAVGGGAHRDDAAGGDPTEVSLRLAALLDITTPGGVVVLAGEWARGARALATGEIVERVHVLALDPPDGMESGGGVSIALTSDEMPVRPVAARGIALDAAHTAPDYMASAARSLLPGARLLAPVETAIPAGLTELARDERNWLAVKGADPRSVAMLKLRARGAK